MEGGVEDTNLRHVGQDGFDGMNAFQVGGVVQRGQVVAGGEGVEHFLGQQYRLAELFAAVHHAVAYGIDFVERLDGSVLGAGQRVEDELYAYGVFGDVFLQNLLFAVGQSQLQERVGQADFLDTALCDDRLAVHVEQLIFDG